MPAKLRRYLSLSSLSATGVTTNAPHENKIPAIQKIGKAYPTIVSLIFFHYAGSSLLPPRFPIPLSTVVRKMISIKGNNNMTET